MYFPTTEWSLLAKASLNGESGAKDAMEELCRRYWLPIHQYIRSRGYPDAESQDLTQGFLIHLLDKSALKKADQQRGRFRSFILGSLTHYLSNDKEKAAAEKRGAGQLQESLSADGSKQELHQAHINAPESLVFDREWAVVVLERALARIQELYLGDAKSEEYRILRQFLPGATQPMSYEDAAKGLRTSLPALKSDIHRIRHRFRELVREEIATTVSAPHEIPAEMQYLHRVLSDPGNELPPPPPS